MRTSLRPTARRIRPPALLATLLVVAVGAGLAVASPQPAHAEGEVTWSIQPSTPAGPDGRSEFSYQVAPGSVITDWVAVTNRSAEPATFRVYAADAKTDYDTAAFTLIGADRASTDLGAWTAVHDGPAACANPADAACAAGLGIVLALDPGARADIPITITVPHDASPGDHAAGIVASFSTGAGDGAASVRRENRVGTRIYLRVDGALRAGVGASGAVAGYDANLNPFAAGGGFFGVDVANTGNTRLSVQPSVRFTGPFGIDLGTVALPEVRNLMPGGTGHVTASVPGIPPLLLLFAEVVLTPAPADGVAAEDPLPAPARASAETWAVPWSLLALIALLVGGGWVVLRIRRRRRDLLAQDLADYADAIRAEERARQTALLAGSPPDSDAPDLVGAERAATVFDKENAR